MKNYWHFTALALTCLFISSCSSNSIPEANPNYHPNKQHKPYTSPQQSQRSQRKAPISRSNSTPSPRKSSQPHRTEEVQYQKGSYSNQSGQIKQLPSSVSSALKSRGISTRGMSVYIQAVNNPNPLLTFQADTPRNPASVMKLITTYASLGILGPNYRWPTEVYTTGSISGGTLRGDLILKGYGSPDLKPNDLQKILQAIRGKGIRNIEGNLVFDNSHFAPIGKSAAAFDGAPHKLYNAQPDALLYNERTSCFVIRPSGGKVNVSCPTPARNVKIVNNIRANNGPCRGKNANPHMSIIPQGKNVTVKFTGSYSTRCGQRKYFKVVSDPANMLFAGIWKTWVGKMGGSINGGFAQHRTPANAQLLYTHYSQPLRNILPTINKKSNNVMARQLLLSIAAKKYGGSGTTSKGARAVNEWLRSRGLNFPELRIENGSGLSRIAKVSARHMGQLLDNAYSSPYRNDLIRSLAVMGVDGTLKKRLVNSSLRGKGNFKTGSLKDVRGIAGYVRAMDGKTYIVSVLHNDPKARSLGRAAHDEVIKWAFTQRRQYAKR